jgi:hypothetical protein
LAVRHGAEVTLLEVVKDKTNEELSESSWRHIEPDTIQRMRESWDSDIDLDAMQSDATQELAREV